MNSGVPVVDQNVTVLRNGASIGVFTTNKDGEFSFNQKKVELTHEETLMVQLGDKSQQFTIAYPLTLVLLDISTPGANTVAVVLNTGSACVEGNVTLVNKATNKSMTGTTTKCSIIFNSTVGSKYQYFVTIPGAKSVTGEFEHKQTNDILQVLIQNENTYLFKLNDQAFGLPAIFVDASLVCQNQAIKARSDLFGNLIFTRKYEQGDACQLKIEEERFERVEKTLTAAFTEITMRPIMAVRVNVVKAGNEPLSGIAVVATINTQLVQTSLI